MIEYTVDDGREPAGPIRLITTILDHREAPALDLARAYAQRWEIETSFDELKTHQRGARAQGRTGGRPTVMNADQLAAAQARRAKGESPTQIAKALGVSRASVYRHLVTAEEPAGADPR